MKNSALRIKTEQLTESAYDIEEYYTAGLQLIAVGNLIKNMVRHMDDLQAKVDNQAEELRKYQQKTYDIDKIVEQLEELISYNKERSRMYDGHTHYDSEIMGISKAIEIVKGGA